jgi:hypothetical protein
MGGSNINDTMFNMRRKVTSSSVFGNMEDEMRHRWLSAAFGGNTSEGNGGPRQGGPKEERETMGYRRAKIFTALMP